MTQNGEQMSTWRLWRPWSLARGARWEPSWPRPGWASSSLLPPACPWPRSWSSSLLPCPYTSTRLRSFGQCLLVWIFTFPSILSCSFYPPCNETQLSCRHCSLAIDLLDRQGRWQPHGSAAQWRLVVQTAHNLTRFSDGFYSWMNIGWASFSFESWMDFMLWWISSRPLQSSRNDRGCEGQAGLEAAQQRQSGKWKRPGI